MCNSSLQVEYAAKFKEIKGLNIIKKMKLLGVAMPKVKLADGTDAPDELFRFLLVSYGSQMGKGYHFDSDSDAAAKLLSYDSLCEAMDVVSNHLDGPNYPAILPLLCRYGNAKQIKILTDSWKTWYGQKGRKAQAVLIDALVLSDTRQAVVWLVGRVLSVTSTVPIAVVVLPRVTCHHIKVALDFFQVPVIGYVEVKQRVLF